MKNVFINLVLTSIFVLFIFSCRKVNAQGEVNRDSALFAAQEIIHELTYCALVTVDSSGQPQIRTMNPFPVKDDLEIWFATSRYSGKVQDIKNNPKVCVYFANQLTAKGYVSINGKASVIDDRELLVQMKRDYWEGIPDWQNKFVLIRIVPLSLDVINYPRGLSNDPVTSGAPHITFD